MTKNEFIKKLSEFCEFSTTDYTSVTKLKSIEGYDSMAIMSMIVFVDENFGMTFTAKQIGELSDFNSLIELIGKDKFEDD